MSDALQGRVLMAVGAGYRTLEAISGSLGTPASEVDRRIRSAIEQRLLVAHQRPDETWTFSLTDTGKRAVAVRSTLGAVPGLGALVTGGRGPAPRQPAAGTVAAASRVISTARRRPVTTSSTIRTPAQEAALAERQAWSFALGVVALVAFFVLVVWLIAL